MDDAFLLKSNKDIDIIPEPHTLCHGKDPICVEVTVNDGKKISTSGGISGRDISLITFSPSKNKVKQRIFRKFPLKRNLKKSAQNLIGAYLLGYNPNCVPDTLMKLQALPAPYLQDIPIISYKKYSSYRLCTPDNKPVNIAHIDFIGEEYLSGISGTPIQLPELGEENSDIATGYCYTGIPMKTGKSPEKAIDGNMETYVGSSSLGIEFDRPVKIDRIRFAPRNANNGIVKNGRYSIYYYDKGWKLADSLTAEKNYIDIELPEGTLYWVVNESNGNEEFPFEFHDGKQKFINLPLE